MKSIGQQTGRSKKAYINFFTKQGMGAGKLRPPVDSWKDAVDYAVKNAPSESYIVTITIDGSTQSYFVENGKKLT